jgi:preprotein translocase subunit YajC
MFPSIAHAQAAAAGQTPSMLESFFPFVLMFVVFYFFIIRPQVRKQKKHAEFVSQMKRGDSVLTSSGVLGTIEGITDKFVTLEVSSGVRLRILKSHIAGLASEEGA